MHVGKRPDQMLQLFTKQVNSLTKSMFSSEADMLTSTVDSVMLVANQLRMWWQMGCKVVVG